MEIWTHFTFRTDEETLLSRYIKENNIPYDYGEILCGVDIGENNPHWETILQLIKSEGNFYLSETKFTKAELLSAQWLTVRSRWYYDYPQPENRYEELTYTQEKMCPYQDCNIGLIQKDYFRFKRTPKWGKRNFCMTNWVYDELFVSSKAKELLEASDLTGFSFDEVKKKGGQELLPDIWQLRIPAILPDGIADLTSNIAQYYICPVCGKRKFRESGRGQFVFYKETFFNAPDFVKSGEWFGGGGASASKKMIISHKAYQFITDNKLDSSLVFEPIRLV